jgi:hypothetical protein
MDISRKRLAKIVALNEHISVILRELAPVIGVGKSGLHTRIPDHFLQTERETAEEKEMPLLVLISLY